MTIKGKGQYDLECLKVLCAKLLKNLKSPIKKTKNHVKADFKAREAFKERREVHKKEGRPIISIDEAGFAYDMPRTHGYAPKGERCHGFFDWHAKGRTNAIGALLGKILLTISLFQCNVDSDVFHTWVMQDLLPKLPSRSVLMLDNASFHKRCDTLRAIEEAGHTIEFLPSYSPDLNPIEHVWAQAKAIRRRTQCNIYSLFSEHFKIQPLNHS